ncbi:GH3 auxin-responsive promoter family protein [Patescibacteria group bacterium]|nr:GH3 auxin-responsive promoter family protein [Patescibacteria group bacterium]
MKKVVETSMKTYFKLRSYRIDLMKKTAVESQDLLLVELLQAATATEFGRDHDFEHISSYEDFNTKVPITSYEDLEPSIRRIMAGEQDVLWPGVIHNFSKSSGTTNDISKYLPVSHESLYGNNYQAGRDLYTIIFSSYPDIKIFENYGSVLSLGGSFVLTEDGAKVGDVSAIIMSELPRWAERHREPSIDIALLPDWKSKIPAIIEETIGKNITHLSGVPTWFVSLFEELRKEKPYQNLREVWPNLELFIHGAVAFTPYRSIFETLLPFDDMKYVEVYNASEGFFAIQDDPLKPGEMLLLTDHGIFYEFVPMDDYGSEHPASISLHGVEVGVNYAMIITTSAGLWRYDLGDTVMFTSTDPYRIKITGRTKHFINVFGEELMVGNADEAIARVSAETGAVVSHYTAGPIFMNDQGRGGHEWVIEFTKVPADVDAFTRLLDETLRSLNSDYDAKRQDDIALQILKLNIVPEGTFMSWMESRGKLGGQHKVPRLSNKRDYIEQLLDLAKK